MQTATNTCAINPPITMPMIKPSEGPSEPVSLGCSISVATVPLVFSRTSSSESIDDDVNVVVVSKVDVVGIKFKYDVDVLLLFKLVDACT